MRHARMRNENNTTPTALSSRGSIVIQPSWLFDHRGERPLLPTGWQPVLRDLSSHPALRRCPDELVHLELKPNIEFVFQDPFHDLARIDPSENG